MPAPKLSDNVLEAALEAYEIYGSKAEAARQLGVASSTFADRLAVARERFGLAATGPLAAEGTTKRRDPILRKLPKKNEVKRYILTSAQNNTRINIGVWHNLMALAEHYEAEILVGTFTYNKAAYGSKAVKRGTGPTFEDRADLWYDPELRKYIADDPIQLAPGLIWCGEINTSPTAVNPLQGFEAYNGRASNIFPHTKFALESVASLKHEATKFNYTTGVVTNRNYIQKKAGLKAEIEHGYGGVIVEVLPNGNWFVRQLAAGPEGSIQDLGVKSEIAHVTTGNRVEAINWGDIHKRALSPEMESFYWGEDGMFEVLRPKYQFMHDVLDFYNRNHHDRKNPHRMFSRFVTGEDSVKQEVHDVADFLDRVSRPWCETIVVDSNHDKAITKWLAETTHHEDPINAIFYLEASLALYTAMADKDDNFHTFEWACEETGADLSRVNFLREDESFVICKDFEGGIESGLHGHLGFNGARGNPKAFKKMGRRTNSGHTHSGLISGPSYVAGVTADEDLGYNIGPSSWSATHIVTYSDATRALITAYNGRWCA